MSHQHENEAVPLSAQRCNEAKAAARRTLQEFNRENLDGMWGSVFEGAIREALDLALDESDTLH